MAHNVEPFTHNLWICTGCGNTFVRVPECHGCEEDPMIQAHVCEFGDAAIIEGDCEEDPILVTTNEGDTSDSA